MDWFHAWIFALLAGGDYLLQFWSESASQIVTFLRDVGD